MQNFKEVCGSNNSVCFEVKPKEGKKFLKWVKDLGCVWENGEEIEPNKGVEFFHLSISNAGLSYVPISAWVSKQPEFKDIKRYVFADFIRTITQNPRPLL